MVSNEPRRVIIGSQNTEFAAKLKKFVEQHEYKVSDIVVMAEHLIEAIEMSYINDEPIYALIITTDLSYKMNDKRLEFLSDCLLTIRSKHSEIKFAVLSNESEGHPFLAELVGIGIYNIFVKASANNSIDVRELIRSFEFPKEFAEVSKYREYNKDILWRKIDRGASELTLKSERVYPAPKIERQIEESVPRTDVQKTLSESQNNVKSKEEKKRPERELIIDDEMEDYRIPFPSIKEKIVVKDRIIGSVVIGITGVYSGVGVTHVSVAMASFLARQGNSVALVECNESSDFKYIELAHEGIKSDGIAVGTKNFKIDGVNYFKSDQYELDLISLLSSEYTYIILDLGFYDTTKFFEEFLRADIQIVVGSGIEWKQRHLERFLSITNEYEQQKRWNIVLPLTDSQVIADVKNNLKIGNVFKLPYQPDPFDEDIETDETIENILSTAKVLTNIKKVKPLIKLIIGGSVFLIVLLILILLLKS
ncbi:hypothetical protein [Paenibacillus terrae]|uniref:hypothetical protein n=1 Tax=Paenibacillus terrae TaxID=159743 RepID=UPI0006964AAD|nr:hypothetical protein [Paenibacillus terrae]